MTVGHRTELGFGTTIGERAEYISGSMAAHALEDSGIPSSGRRLGDLLGAPELAALREDYAAADFPPPDDGWLLDELAWVPCAALAHVLPDFRPTRAAVEQWCTENAEREPHAQRAEAVERATAAAKLRAARAGKVEGTATAVRESFDGDPVPLGVREGSLPPFPVDALPPVYGDMVRATAVAYQVDTAMSGPVALAALAAACGGCVEAVPRPGWEEVTALHVLVAANPSERKSAVVSALSKPLVRAERGLIEAVTPLRADALTRRAIAEKAAEDAAKAAAKHAASAAAYDDASDLIDPVENAVALAQRVETIRVPSVPRLLADDVTPEALGSLLAEHHGRIAIMSAEGGIFATLAGRYSNNVPSLDVWLKGHSGDPIRVDRKGRAPELVDRPALTACLMLQPSILAAIGRNPDFRGRGLLARALFALPASKLGQREADPPPVPEGVAMAYGAALADLARVLREEADDENGPARVKFDADAARDVTALLAEVEPRLIDPSDLGGDMEGWGGKYVGAVVRIAVLLHMAEHGPAGIDQAVTAETFAAARRIGKFFEAHSVAALGGSATAGDTAREKAVLEALRGLHAAAPYQPITRRSLQKDRVIRRMNMTASDLESALGVLADHYVVRCFTVKVGGRDQVNIYLHPDAAS